MQPTYQPTSVSRPAPQSVSSRDQQAAGVHTHVTVNVVHSRPAYTLEAALMICGWILIAPPFGFVCLILLVIFTNYPWLLLSLAGAVGLWLSCRAMRR